MKLTNLHAITPKIYIYNNIILKKLYSQINKWYL